MSELVRRECHSIVKRKLTVFSVRLTFNRIAKMHFQAQKSELETKRIVLLA